MVEFIITLMVLIVVGCVALWLVRYMEAPAILGKVVVAVLVICFLVHLLRFAGVVRFA